MSVQDLTECYTVLRCGNLGSSWSRHLVLNVKANVTPMQVGIPSRTVGCHQIWWQGYDNNRLHGTKIPYAFMHDSLVRVNKKTVMDAAMERLQAPPMYLSGVAISTSGSFLGHGGYMSALLYLEQLLGQYECTLEVFIVQAAGNDLGTLKTFNC